MDLSQRTASLKFLIRDRAGQFTSSFDARVHRRGHQDPGQPAAGTPSETSGCILHLFGLMWSVLLLCWWRR